MLNSQPRGQRFKSRHGQGSFLPLIHENILEEDQERRTSPESESLQTKGRVSTNTQKFTIKPYKQLISPLTPRNSPLNPTKATLTSRNSLLTALMSRQNPTNFARNTLHYLVKLTTNYQKFTTKSYKGPTNARKFTTKSYKGPQGK